MDPIMGIQTQAGAIRQEELTEANLVPVVIRLTERVGQIEDVLRTLGDIEELHERLTQVEEHLFAAKEILTVKEAKEFLGISESQLYKLTGGVI